MESHFLRETLRVGQYKLNDETEVLRERACTKTRLKWLREGMLRVGVDEAGHEQNFETWRFVTKLKTSAKIVKLTKNGVCESRFGYLHSSVYFSVRFSTSWCKHPLKIHVCHSQTRRLRDLAKSGGWVECLSAIATWVRDSYWLQQGLHRAWLDCHSSSDNLVPLGKNICCDHWGVGHWEALEVGVTASLTVYIYIYMSMCIYIIYIYWEPKPTKEELQTEQIYVVWELLDPKLPHVSLMFLNT